MTMLMVIFFRVIVVLWDSVGSVWIACVFSKHQPLILYFQAVGSIVC